MGADGVVVADYITARRIGRMVFGIGIFLETKRQCEQSYGNEKTTK